MSPTSETQDEIEEACQESYRQCVADRRARIERVIAENPNAGATELAKKANVSRQAITNHTKKMDNSLSTKNMSNALDDLDLSHIRARVGKHPIDLTALSPRAQEQIRAKLGLDSTATADPDRPAAKNTLFDSFRNAGGPESHTEWFTRAELFVPLGNPIFDLDPASPGARLSHVPAIMHLTKAENGLLVDWGDGFVWLNPPWGKRNGMFDFMRKFIAHNNGIAIIPCYAANPWWLGVVGAVDAVLFPRSRISFINGRTGEDGEPMGVCLVAMGERGVDVLRTGERNGLGKLMTPIPPTVLNGEAKQPIGREMTLSFLLPVTEDESFLERALIAARLTGAETLRFI